MTYTSTYRAAVRTALNTDLQTFQAAHPTLLNQVYRALPRSVTAPCAWIGDFTEPAIYMSAAVVTRQPQVEIILVQGEYENAATADAQDVLVDTFLSYAVNLNTVGPGVVIGIATADRELTFGGAGGSTARYLATVVTLTLDLMEGGI